MDALLASTALLQQYPAHSIPVYQNGSFFLRQDVWISHFEIDMELVGSQSNTLVAGDLYNSVRYAVTRNGKAYSDSNVPYLTGVMTGTNLQDTQHVYIDQRVALPSQAFDTLTNYNVPMVIHRTHTIPVNRVLSCFSTNASGSGAAWDTTKEDYTMFLVSDSSVSPNPQVALTFRCFFTFMQR